MVLGGGLEPLWTEGSPPALPGGGHGLLRLQGGGGGGGAKVGDWEVGGVVVVGGQAGQAAHPAGH